VIIRSPPAESIGRVGDDGLAFSPTRRAIDLLAASTGGKRMSANVYGVTEIVGTSPNGIDAAIEVGIARASTTLRGLDWFEVTEVRGHINDGKVGHYQVSMKVGFRMDA
jgi:flavin-binding protein dodecin